jgi:hypothetical protein
MALTGDMFIEQTDPFHILNDVAAPGVVLCYNTAGSGVALGASRGVCQLAANPSGLKVFGGLLQNFVSIDETRYHRNWHKNEQVVGEPADVLRKGWFVTDKVTGTPTEGNKAYLTSNGVVTPTVSATGGTAATPLVGEFGGSKDENGYVKLIFNLPHAG